MVKILKWKKIVNQKGNEWWIKGEQGGKYKNQLPRQWIHLREQTPYIKKSFKGSNWSVEAPIKINSKTMHGKSVNFTTKSQAMIFVKAYIRKH